MLCILQMFVSVGDSRIIWSVSFSVMWAFALGLFGLENGVSFSLSVGWFVSALSMLCVMRMAPMLAMHVSQYG